TAPTRLGYGAKISYGLGTRLGSLEGHTLVGHTGNGSGFNHMLVHYSEDGITIAVLTNSESSVGARLIEAAIARRMLGIGPYAPRDLPVPAPLADAVIGAWTDGIDRWSLSRAGERVKFTLANGDERALGYRGATAFGIAPEFEVRFVLPPRTKRGRPASPLPDGLPPPSEFTGTG